MNANMEVTQAKQTKSPSIKNTLKKYNLFFIFLGFILIGSILSNQFLSVQNLLNLLQQSSFVGIVSIGMTFVILVAGIDLSVGAVLALAGMLVSILLGTGMNPILAIVITLIAGAFLGFVNGFVSTKFKVPAFIATLAMMVSARGLALLSTNGEPIYDLPEGFIALGGNVFGKIPFTAVVWIALTIVALVILKYTTFGRKIYAVGGNEESSRLSGIPVEKYVTWCFV
ncbi:ABC transporter permease, partial [Peribacillus sp. NPDC058002]